MNTLASLSAGQWIAYVAAAGLLIYGNRETIKGWWSALSSQFSVAKTTLAESGEDSDSLDWKAFKRLKRRMGDDADGKELATKVWAKIEPNSEEPAS